MTGSISPSIQTASYRVPGVYSAPRPRAPATLPIRTDVAGFIGFEPRVRDATPPSALTGGPPPVGHAFFVNVSTFQLHQYGVRVTVPAAPNLLLSQSASSIPISDGESIYYTIAVGDRRGTASLIVLAGSASASGTETAPLDADVATAVATFFQAAGDSAAVAALRQWVRLADVDVCRTGASIRLSVLPALRITRCDDWNDYLAAFGTPVADGMFLGSAVRAYFANGGSRCYVSTVRRPDVTDSDDLALAAQAMVGVQGSSQVNATGLERLLLVDEVSFVDVPDLYASAVNTSTVTVQLPPPAQDACFQPCSDYLPAPVIVEAAGPGAAGAPLYPADLTTPSPWSDPFLGVQLQLAARCIVERWRVLLLLSPPLVLDGDAYVPPEVPDAVTWRNIFDAQQKAGILGGSDPTQVACIALYHPWLVIQEVVGDPTYPLPPTPLAAGIIARRDLARGPQIAPANETLSTVVGVTTPIDDADNALLYSPEPDANDLPVVPVNLVRPFAGYGVQVWGARTLSSDQWMRFINVRRAVSAIERRCKAALDAMVFEPNTPFLWAQITQSVLGVLMPMFASGGLRGSTPAQAFYIRCDSTLNTPDSIALGLLVCEVGVAVAAPAEFIVFRIGRKEGVVEVVE
jgi:uncharacterized protein